MVAALGNTYKVAKGEIGVDTAIANVARETVGTGIATAAGGAAVTALGLGGMVGLVGFAAVATACKGAWDSAVYPKTKAVVEEAEA